MEYFAKLEWLVWCNNRPEDGLLIQEANWKLNYQWEIDQWYYIYSEEVAASQLAMARKSLLRSSLLAYVALIPGRLFHIRLMLDQIYDLCTTYQTAWNTSKPIRILLRDTQDLWRKLSQDILHTPNSYMLVVVGDFNCPLQKDLPCIGSHDPRFDIALQSDRQEFQQMIQDLSLVAILCRQKYIPIFLHDNHQIRIDFIFLRASQVRWKQLSTVIDGLFECIGLHQGPQHRYLLLGLPKWHAIHKAPSRLQTINHFQIRQEMISDTLTWQHFVHEATSCILRHREHSAVDPVEICHSMELDSVNCVLIISLNSGSHRPQT